MKETKKDLFANSKNGGGIFIKTNKKNAFTLIELLAIIVILAIIAVITVPIILNIIENSKKGAATDSAYGFKDAVNKAYVTKLSGNSDYNITDGEYTISDLKTQIGLSLSGKEPASNSLVIIAENNITAGCLQYDDYKVEFAEGKVTKTEKGDCSEYEYDDGTLKIGDTVNYSTSLNGVALDNWKVFYKEGDYTYLILGDYLPNSAITGITGLANGQGSYGIIGSGNTYIYELIRTTSNWNSLLTGTLNETTEISVTANQNVWAMGSPTLELWVSSWNKSYPNDHIYASLSAVPEVYGGSLANNVGFSENPNYPFLNLANTTGINNNLYFLESIDNCTGYWLGTPYNESSNTHSINNYNISGTSMWDYEKAQNSYTYNSFRPIIKFPTSIVNQ